MSKLPSGVSKYMDKEYRITILVKEMDISWLMVHDQQIKEKIKKKERKNNRAKTSSINFSQ